MTIVIAWTRKLNVPGTEELVFASDSRLNGGRFFDCSQKIIPLSRGDCAIAFSGSTDDAYPLMLQLFNSIENYEPSRKRANDISNIRTNALDLFKSILSEIEVPANIPANEDPAKFLFGGYSWVEKRFLLWSLELSQAERCYEAKDTELLILKNGKFQFEPWSKANKKESGDLIAFTGDVADLAKSKLLSALDSLYPKGKGFSSLNLEPLQVLIDMLRQPDKSNTIGGAPQIVKVHQYMQTTSVAIQWPDEKGAPYINGRQCLTHESKVMTIYEPDHLDLI